MLHRMNAMLQISRRNALAALRPSHAEARAWRCNAGYRLRPLSMACDMMPAPQPYMCQCRLYLTSGSSIQPPGTMQQPTRRIPRPKASSGSLHYRRQVLQLTPATPAGISSGRDIANSGTQCSGTGNTCQNTPTTVNNNQQVNVYNYLPPSKHPPCHAYCPFDCCLLPALLASAAA